MNKSKLLTKPVSDMNVFELIQFECLLPKWLKGKRARDRVQLMEKHQEAVSRLGEFAILDPLTKLLNRTAYTIIMNDMVTRCSRRGTNFVHVIYDVDNFREVNTRYSHEGGDAALKTLASIVREECNNPMYKGSYAAILRLEHPVRLGGEEIALIMPITSDIEGLRKADTLRRKIDAETKKMMAPCGLTVSGGVVSFSQVSDVFYQTQNEKSSKKLADAMYVFSDFAMYHAKDLGKNCVRDFTQAVSAAISPEWHTRLGNFADMVHAYKEIVK